MITVWYPIARALTPAASTCLVCGLRINFQRVTLCLPAKA